MIAACAKPIARKLAMQHRSDSEFIPAWKKKVHIKQQTASHYHAFTPDEHLLTVDLELEKWFPLQDERVHSLYFPDFSKI